MDINDVSGNKWWAAMYRRTIYTDPMNDGLGSYPYAGLETPIVPNSNDQVSVAYLRHQDGVNTYKMGAVSPQAAAHMGNPQLAALGAAPGGTAGGISGCTARTGNPSLCTQAFLGRAPSRNIGNFVSLGHLE
jgi:hypothetical protein